MKRRQFLKTGAAGVGAVGLGAAMSGPGASWKGIQIDAYCKGYKLVKFEVENGEFVLEDGQDGERVDDNTFKVYNHYFDLTIEPTRTEEGEIREFEFHTDADVVDHVVVKGGPDELHYLENPLSDGSDGSGLHAPVNPNAGGNDEQYYETSYVEFRVCEGIAVDVTSTSTDAKPADVIDLTDDDVRLAVTHGPFHHDDQFLFDNGVDTKHGNGIIQGDGELHFYFPFEEAFVDDPGAVRNADRFRAELLVESEDGTTWAGDDGLPPIV